MSKPNRTFHECYPEIEVIVEKKRKEWTFKASMMLDYDDIKSIILVRIWQKWHLYDQSRPLGGWIATTVHNAFVNELRNVYTKTSSPCTRCPCNLGTDANGKVNCSVFGTESPECPPYKKWYDNKRHVHQAKMPVPLQDHLNEYNNQADNDFNFEIAIGNIHERIKPRLTPRQWQVYEKLYIEHKSDEEASAELNFKTSEKGRKAGYNRLRQIKIIILKKAKEILLEYGIESIK